MKNKTAMFAFVLLLAPRQSFAAQITSLAPAVTDDDSQDDSFDPSQYPPAKLADIVKNNPCKKEMEYEVKDVPFSSELVYEEETREIPAGDKELVRQWTASLNAEDQASSFGHELLIKDGNVSWWMPLPDSLLQPLHEDVQAGDHPMFYMSLSGCVDGKPVISIEEYSLPDYEDLEEESASYITWVTGEAPAGRSNTQQGFRAG